MRRRTSDFASYRGRHDRPTPAAGFWRLLQIGGFLILSATVTGCREDPAGPGGGKSSNPTWSEASHGRVTPNYSIIFPQDSLNRIEIVMSPAAWDSIRTNMVSLWGFNFGSGGMGPGGGGFPTTDPTYVRATVRFNGKVWEKVGFRLKGNSSLSSTWRQGNYKLPFRLNFDRFEDEYPEINNQRLYGFKEISASPAWNDPSLIREKVAADIFRMAGIPAARTAFYRVYIDWGTGLRYSGVYTFVEVVDDTMVKDQFSDDSGNIYKPTSRFQNFVQTQFEKKNNKVEADWTDVQGAIAALISPQRTSNPAQWRASLELAFHVDHFLQWLAINNAMVNWDVYGAIAHNYYLYSHPTSRLTWIPWDHNEALNGSPGITGTVGGGGGGGGPNPNRGMSLSLNEVNSTWPLIRYLADDPVYYARYQQHMRTFVDETFTIAKMDALFERYHGMVAPYAIGTNGEQPGSTHIPNPSAFTAALQGLKTHLRNRQTLVNQFLP